MVLAKFYVVGSGTVVIATALAGLIGLVALAYATGWDATWRALSVTPLTPFFDMHAVTDHAACFAQGFNAYELNSCNSVAGFNYPPIWLRLGYLGIDGSDADWLAVLATLSAFVVITSLLSGRSAFDGVLASVGIFSPPVMMGVERGNIDLWIFALVGSAALTFRHSKLTRAFAASLIVFAAVVLKLYPIFCVALIAKFNKRTLLFVVTVIFSSSIYLYSISEYLPLIRANTPTTFMLSYGYKAVFLGLDHLRQEAGRELLHMADTWLPVALLSIVLASGIALAFCFTLYRERLCIITDGAAGAAFLFGSGIYCGTFLLGTNFIYRLIFLLLCIPQLQDWTKERNSRTVALSFCFQVLILLTLWSNGNSNGHSTFLMPAQLLNWTIFFGFIGVLTLNCTESIRRIAYRDKLALK